MANIPIKLPPIPQDPLVLHPNPPALLPAPNDIAGAKYLQDVTISQNLQLAGQKCSTQDLAEAEMYKHSVIHQDIAAPTPIQVAPAWFVPTMQVIMPQLLVPVHTDILRLTNQLRGNGQVAHFEVVPFVDGSNPTVAPHGLPPLISFSSIHALNPQDVIAYLNGYGIPIPNDPNPAIADNLRKDAIKKAVSGQC